MIAFAMTVAGQFVSVVHFPQDLVITNINYTVLVKNFLVDFRSVIGCLCLWLLCMTKCK